MINTQKPFSDALIEKFPNLGMSAKEIRSYSLLKILRRAEDLEDISGLEKDVHDDLSRRGRGLFTNIAVPMDIFDEARRDLTVAANGGSLVPTVVGAPISVLRNALTAVRLGAHVVSGLRGNVASPRATSPVTAGSLSENAKAQISDPTFDQPVMIPRRINAKIAFSKQFSIQTSASAEAWARRELLAAILLKLDSLIYTGSGVKDEPLGIVNTPGVGSVQFNGAATYDDILSFEQQVALANAETPGAKIAFVTTPSVRNKFKKAPAALTGATQVTNGKAIWESYNWGDGTTDGSIADWRAAVTQQIPNNQILFGDFNSLIIGLFGDGLDLNPLVNPYTRANEGVIETNVDVFADVFLQHPQSFVVSANSAAQ